MSGCVRTDAMAGRYPQWGHCPTCGDALEKRDSSHRWTEPCEGCGEPITVSLGTMEVVGAYHSGCFGSPWCSCRKPHKGDCPPTE